MRFNGTCFSDDNIFISGKDAGGPDKGINGQGAGNKMSGYKWDGEAVICMLAGNLAKQDIVSGQISQYKGRPAFRA